MSSLQLEPLPHEIDQPMFRAICGAFVAQWEIYKKYEFSAHEITEILDAYDNVKSVMNACNLLVRHGVLTVTDTFIANASGGGKPTKLYAMVKLLEHKDEPQVMAKNKIVAPIGDAIAGSHAMSNDKMNIAMAAKNVGLTPEDSEAIAKMPDRIVLTKITKNDLALKDKSGSTVGKVAMDEAIKLCELPKSMTSMWGIEFAAAEDASDEDKSDAAALNQWMRGVETTILNYGLRLRAVADHERANESADELLITLDDKVKLLDKRLSSLFTITGQPVAVEAVKVMREDFANRLEQDKKRNEKLTEENVEELRKLFDKLQISMAASIEHAVMNWFESNMDKLTRNAPGDSIKEMMAQYQQGFSDGVKFLATKGAVIQI